MKKVLSLFLVLVMLLLLTACGSSEEEKLRDALNEKIDGNITYSDEVRNDATGHWRLARVATTADITDYVLDYYKAYFASDDEVHVIVNFTTNTTTVVTVMSGSTLSVDVHEYVDKEEHDAKILAGGDLLASYFVDIETGEIEKIS